MLEKLYSSATDKKTPSSEEMVYAVAEKYKVNPQLEKHGDEWFANTPEGYRRVQLVFINFCPSIYYQREDGTVLATGIPDLSHTEVTRKGLFSKKSYELMLRIVEKQLLSRSVK